MKFRSPTDTPVQVSVGVHSALVGPEGRELDEHFHKAAYSAGCLTGKMKAPEVVENTKGELDELKAVIKSMIDNPCEGDFTNAGLPDLTVLSKLAGYTVSREDMAAAWYELANTPPGE